MADIEIGFKIQKGDSLNTLDELKGKTKDVVTAMKEGGSVADSTFAKELPSSIRSAISSVRILQDEYKQTKNVSKESLDTTKKGIEQTIDKTINFIQSLKEEIALWQEARGKVSQQKSDAYYRKGGELDYAKYEQQEKEIDAIIRERTKLMNAMGYNVDALQQEEAELDKIQPKSVTFRTELRNVRNELNQMQEAGQANTPEYEALQDRMVQLTKTMKITGAETKNLANPQAGFQGVLAGVTGLSGGITALSGALSLFGGENEKVQKITNKLNALMSITIGLQSLQSLTLKTNAFQTNVVAKLRKFYAEALQAENEVLEDNNKAQVENTALEAKETLAKGIETTATEVQTASNWSLTASIKAVGMAIKSIPVIGWIIAGISALTAVILAFHDKNKKASEERVKAYEKEKEVQDSFNKDVASNASKSIVAVNNLSTAYRKLGNSMSEKKKFIKDHAKDFDDLGVSIKNVADADNLLISHTQDFIKSIKLRAEAMAIENRMTENQEKILNYQMQNASDKKLYNTYWNLVNKNGMGTWEARNYLAKNNKTYGFGSDINVITQRINDFQNSLHNYNEAIVEQSKLASQLAKLQENDKNIWQSNNFKPSGNDNDKKDKKDNTEENRKNILASWGKLMTDMSDNLISDERTKGVTNAWRKLQDRLAEISKNAIDLKKNGGNKEDIDKLVEQSTELAYKEYDKGLDDLQDRLTKKTEKKEKETPITTLLAGFFKDAEELTSKEISNIIAQIDALMAYLNGTTDKLPDGISQEVADKIRNKPESLNVLKEQRGKLLQGLSSNGALAKILAGRNMFEIDDNGKQTSVISKKGIKTICEGYNDLFEQINSCGDALKKAFGDNVFSEILSNVAQLEKGVTSVMTCLASNDKLGAAIAGFSTITTLVSNVVSYITDAQEEHLRIIKEINQALEEQAREYQQLLLQEELAGEKYDTIFGTDSYGKFNNTLQSVKDTWKAYNDYLDLIKNKYPNTERDGFGNGYTQDYSAWLLKVIDRNTGKLNTSLAQSLIDNDELDEEFRNYLQKLLENFNLYEDAVEQQADYLSSIFGNLGDSLSDALVDAFQNGTDAGEAFADSVKDAFASLLKQKILNTYFGNIFSQYEQELKDANGDIDKYKEILERLVQAVKEAMPGAEELMNEYPEVFADDRSESSRAISGMSQETAEKLEGMFTAVQGHTYRIAGGVDNLVSCASGIASDTATMRGYMLDMHDWLNDMHTWGITIRS